MANMSKLKQVRLARKIRQNELARRLNVKSSTICEMERSGIKTMRTASKYAKALNCEAIFLLEGLDN